jgi:hypothetical protein
VDNRVEAASRVPGESSEEVVHGGGESPDGSASAADTATPAAQVTAAAADGSAAAAPGPTPQGALPRSQPMSQPSPAPSLMSAPTQTASGGPGHAQTSPLAAAGVTSSARGIASRISASFSGLTKPKPKLRTAPAPRPTSPASFPTAPVGRPPAHGGLPPAHGAPAQRQAQQSRPAQFGQPTRRALLSLERIEPMSVLKFSFLISLVGWVVLFVAVAVIYFTLSKLGVFTKIETTVGLVTANKAHSGADAASWFSASRILEYTALVCTINAVLFTALATVGAALYNLVASLTGGVEVTLKESD